MFKKNRPKNSVPASQNGEPHYENNNVSSKPPVSPVSPVSKNSLQFYCQLAHGSPTAFVAGFSNVKELYQKIGECFDIPYSEILFCTLNTYKIDMKKLLGGQIGLEDFIFAHRKGRPKEVELVKTEDALGLTITDNGAGYAFIKRIKEGSVIHSIQHIQVGDHIEKLNGDDMVGKRHFEVAKLLKEIPKGDTFTIRLVEPMKSGFTSIAPKTGRTGKKPGLGTGKGTLRFKAGGQAEIAQQFVRFYQWSGRFRAVCHVVGLGLEDLKLWINRRRGKQLGSDQTQSSVKYDDTLDAGIEKINNILESFMGINDSELATQIWELSDGKNNSMDFAEAVDDSDLQAFQFTDELIIELWGAITDARDGRIK